MVRPICPGPFKLRNPHPAAPWHGAPSLFAAPRCLILARRQKRGVDGAWGLEEQHGSRVRSSPVVCHTRWWQGKFASQRCLICPGCTYFLEKPMRILLSTSWMKKAMDSHSDWQGGSPLPCELKLICGAPIQCPRALEAGVDVQQRGPEVQIPSLTGPGCSGCAHPGCRDRLCEPGAHSPHGACPSPHFKRWASVVATLTVR